MAEEFNTQLFHVAENWLTKKKVRFTKRGLRDQLFNHPYYPSLMCLSETLTAYKVHNRGLIISEEQLDELPAPFFAFINIEEINTSDFVNVLEVSKDTVTYFNDKIHTLSREKFIENWKSKVVLLAESDEKSIEQNYFQNQEFHYKKFRQNALLILMFSTLFALGFIVFLKSTHWNLIPVLFFVSSILGLTISTLLLVFEIDKSNKFINNICTSGFKTNCNAVLTSSASKILGVSWAEIGFYYFSALTLYLLFPFGDFSEKIPVISILSFATALYIPFSLSYQYLVIKQWCKLCLLIQLTFTLQLIWALIYGNINYQFNFSNIALLITSFLLPVIAWNFIKPFIQKSNELLKFKSAYNRIISRQDIFEATLSEQPELINGWEELGIISKGNPQAQNVIVKICSPSCHYCNIAHGTLNNLLLINDNVKVITLYSVNSDSSDERSLPVSYFLALAELGQDELLKEAMDYWYLTEDRNVQTLSTLFPVNRELLDAQLLRIDKMKEWCKVSEIYYTPTIYWNGKRLPASYDLEGLLNLYITR